MAGAVRKLPGEGQASKFLSSNGRHVKFKKKRKAAQIQLSFSPQKKFARQCTPQASSRGQNDATPSMLSVKGQHKINKHDLRNATSTELLQRDIRSKKTRTGLIPFQVKFNIFISTRQPYVLEVLFSGHLSYVPEHKVISVLILT